jgi:hypothetical protein
MSQASAPIGPDAPFMQVMATMHAMRRHKPGGFGPVRRGPATEVIHRDRW